jgi:4-nitrophenyl phosphatase
MPQLPHAVRGLVLDMDGVLWRDIDPIGDLGHTFARIAARDLRVVLCTNNSTRTPGQYLEKLRGFGVRLEAWQIITSSGVLAHTLRRRFPEGGPVYVLGEDGLTEALRENGFRPISDGETTGSVAVAMGMDRGSPSPSSALQPC